MQTAATSDFIMQRPALHGYRACSFPDLTIETYRSDAGEMRARTSRHRITLNRTTHRRYAHRFGDLGPTARIARPCQTLGFEPAGTMLWVDGDDADYVSIFQEPDLYRTIQEQTRRPCDLADHSFLAPPDPTTLRVIEALASLTAADVAPEPMLAEQLGLSLALCVLRMAERPVQAGGRGSTGLSSRQIRAVLAHVEEQMGRHPLTLNELATVAGLSPFHFSRAFKAATGCPPHRYVVERRIERAKELIRKGGLGLAEIAQATGFADQAHFSSVFRRATGTTPGRFRSVR
jgi:AraC family transcriptional regulator